MKQSPIETEATYQIDDDQSVSEAVLDAVAERAGVGVLDLSVPLYDAVDPDALNAFYRACGEESASVSFSYYGYDVEVSGNGRVVLTEQMPSSADCDAFEVCGRCGDRLTGTDWYPAATRVATDGEILVLSFCDERCRVAWDDAD